MFISIALASAVILGYASALMVNTENLQSQIVFKLLPFCSATLCLIALVAVNWAGILALV